MKNIIRGIELNVDKANYSPIATLKQEDNATIELILYRGGEEFNIAGQTVTLAAKRSDKIIIEQVDGFNIENNVLTVDLKNNIIAKTGLVYLELTLKDSKGSMTTLDFYLKVNEKILGEDNINASDEIASLDKIKLDFKHDTENIMDKFEADYDSLKRVIIDENQAANLQNQVNGLGSQLSENTKLINLNTSEVNKLENAKATKTEVEVERKRIDLLSKIENGETEGNTELLDIRIGEDGVSYDTAGQSVRSQFKKVNSQITNIEQKTECIQHINLINSKNIKSGYLSQDLNVSTIESFNDNNEYVTSPIINVASNEKFYVFVTGFSVALFYSSDGILREKQTLTNNTMQEVTIPTNENTIVKMRIFNSSSNVNFFISRTSNTLEDNNNVTIENLTPSRLLIDKLKNNLEYDKLKNNVSEIDSSIFEKADKKVPYDFTNIKAFIRYDNGNITESIDGNSTDFISLTDDVWLVSGRCQYSSCLIATYDSNKAFLRSYGRENGSLIDYIDYEFKAKQDEKYAKFGSIYTTLTLAKKQTVKVIKDFSNSNLKGKSIYADGDSITFGAKGDSYIKQIAENEGMILTNGAISGTSLATREGRTDSICERIKALTGSYDYITVSGGTNDAFANVNLGNVITDTNQQYLVEFDTTTTLGAMEEICRTLIYNFPRAKKLFVLTHRLLNGSGTTWSNSLQDKYWDGIIKVLEKWGIPFIDMRNFPFASFNENYLNLFFGEGESIGTHPNTEGYKEFYVNPITEKIKML